MQNITISAWNSSNIILTPQNCNGTGSSWAVNTKEGASVHYRRCTSSRTPSARLSFTGSAVYYLSTYFVNQTVQFCLDGICSARVSLSPPPGISANSTARKVMWYQVNLPDGERTVELFPAINGSTLAVDTFIYTTDELPESPSSLSSFSSSSSSSSSLPSPPSLPSISTTSTRLSTAAIPLGATGSRTIRDSQTVGLIFGAIVGTMSGLILLGIVVMMYRRRQRLRDMRRFHTFSPQTFQRRRYNNSSHRDTQRSRITSFSFDEAPYSKSADPIGALPVSQRAGSSTAKHFIQSGYSYLDLDSQADSRTHSEKTNRHTDTVNPPVPSYKSNYPKLEPLRKAT